MKTFKFLLLVLIIFLAGCQEDDLFDNSSSPGELKNTGGIKSRTPSAPVSMTVRFIKSSGTMAFVYPSDDCSGNMQFLVQGDGVASHLGHFTVENRACMSLAGDFLSPTTGTLTAANGDQIFTIMVNYYIGSDGLEYYEYDLQNGTGRFEGVTGNITMYGKIDMVNMTWNLAGEGTIVYE
jgi:hypothetical protein